MSVLSRFRRRGANHAHIAQDMETYLAEKTEALIEAGVSADEARYRARREFGNVTLLQEASRDEWNWAAFDRWVNDLRFALRALRRNPGFACTSIFTLALGIGVNAAIFSVLYAVILRTLPVPNAQQLRLVTLTKAKGEVDSAPILSYPVVRQMQTAAGPSASIGAFSSPLEVQARGKGNEPEQVNAQLVSGAFFKTLGVSAQAGRLLNESDDQAAAPYPAVLGYAYWAKHFGSDLSVIGRPATLNHTPVTIVGVLGRGFSGMAVGEHPDFWLPLAVHHDLPYSRNIWNSNGDNSKSFLLQPEIRWLQLVARIYEPGAEPRVRAALKQVYTKDLQREVKGYSDPVAAREVLRGTINLQAGDRGLGAIREQYAKPLTVLMVAAALVLLIACANLTSLALARAAARQREIAVRCSIGASRGRIVRQFLTETSLLAMLGGITSVPVAALASQLLLRWATGKENAISDAGMSAPVLAFIGGVSVVIGLLFGLLPALQVIKVSLADTLKAQSKAISGARLPWGRTLIGLQVMFSFALLTGAALFIRTLVNYGNLALGFSPQQVVTVQVDPRSEGRSEKQLRPVYDRILAEVEAIPGVRSAALADCGLAQGCQSISGIRIPGRPAKPGEQLSMQENVVTPAYFGTVGLHLLSGRLFNEHDTGKGPILVVINQTAVRQYFNWTNPIGRYYTYGGDNPRFEIIGVVADARVNDVHDEPAPMAYSSEWQNPSFVSHVEIKSEGDPKTIEGAIRSALRRADPNLPILRVKRLSDQVESNLQREQLLARLASSFAFLALALASLGIYGVLSYTIARRTSELGLRLALGAEQGSVRWLVLKEALTVVAIGLGVGIPVAVAMTRLVKGLLYGIVPADPVSLAFGAAILLLIAMAAALVPAMRASRVDPMVALRYE